MKRNAVTAIIIVLALILAGLMGLLVYLELDRRGNDPALPPESTGNVSQETPAETRADPATDPENPLYTLPPAFTHETESTEFLAPEIPIENVDPMDPGGVTEGPEVDPNLGADTPVDPTENELPMVEG